MGLIILFVIIISINWITHLLVVFTPSLILKWIGQGFWVIVGVIILSFVVWCFDD